MPNGYKYFTYEVHPAIYPAGDAYFQQENSPYHTTGLVLIWFDEHYRDFTVLSSPVQSPDLNLIQNLWDEIGRFHQAAWPITIKS